MRQNQRGPAFASKHPPLATAHRSTSHLNLVSSWSALHVIFLQTTGLRSSRTSAFQLFSLMFSPHPPPSNTRGSL